MLDTDNLEQSDLVATVEPDDSIYEELGNNTYDTKDIISELIDNSLAAKIDGQMLNVLVQVIRDGNGKPKRFIIRDDASGIPSEVLGKAIAPAGKQTQDSLNEHGLGMKQAIAALGKLDYLLTKTVDDEKAKVVREFRFGTIPIYYAEYDKLSGTEISVTDLKTTIKVEPASLTMTLAPYLGARYRKYLTPENPAMRLEIQLLDEGKDAPRTVKVVEACKPVYFHPSTRENRPVIEDYLLEGRGWKAKLTFGYAPQSDSEYAELGVEPLLSYSPYYVSLSKQGLDVLIHDRVILFHQLSELGIVPNRHNQYNGVRGEINLIHGFSTAITKNSFIVDDNFSELVERIKEILTGEKAGPRNAKKDYLGYRAVPEQLPEKVLRDRLANWLATNTIPSLRRETVRTEYVVDGVEGYIDVLADNEAWELKVEQADALDVYQLFMYMDIDEIDQGYLVAKSYSTGARVAADRIKEKHNKTITLTPYSELPITGALSAEENTNYL